jgi:hypothetical protein
MVASIRFRNHTHLYLLASVAHFKFTGKLSLALGSDTVPSDLKNKLEPRSMDVLLLATHSRVQEADTLHCGAPVVPVTVNGEDCAWVPLNKPHTDKSFLAQVRCCCCCSLLVNRSSCRRVRSWLALQFNAVLEGNGEALVPTTGGEMQDFQECAVRQVEGAGVMNTRQLKQRAVKAEAKVRSWICAVLHCACMHRESTPQCS